MLNWTFFVTIYMANANIMCLFIENAAKVKDAQLVTRRALQSKNCRLPQLHRKPLQNHNQEAFESVKCKFIVKVGRLQVRIVDG